MIPSKSGTAKLSAHDNVKTVANVARSPSAKPRASICMRTAGKVTSDGSTAESLCSTTGGGSAVAVSPLLGTDSATTHVQVHDFLHTLRTSHTMSKTSRMVPRTPPIYIINAPRIVGLHLTARRRAPSGRYRTYRCKPALNSRKLDAGARQDSLARAPQDRNAAGYRIQWPRGRPRPTP